MYTYMFTVDTNIHIYVDLYNTYIHTHTYTYTLTDTNTNVLVDTRCKVKIIQVMLVCLQPLQAN